MDNFRDDVAKLLSGEQSTVIEQSPTAQQITTTTSSSSLGVLIYTRTLSRGTSGEDVRALQNALMKLGYSVGSAGADGDFGGMTERAVIEFQ
jgi:peptidoglycan hydrolase-like protein with peptidoglycan-binding domain